MGQAYRSKGQVNQQNRQTDDTAGQSQLAEHIAGRADVLTPASIELLGQFLRAAHVRQSQRLSLPGRQSLRLQVLGQRSQMV